MIMLADPLIRETRVAVQREGAKGAFTLRGVILTERLEGARSIFNVSHISIN